MTAPDRAGSSRAGSSRDALAATFGGAALGLHSASMVALGVLDGPRRRLGLTDGLIAAPGQPAAEG